MVSRGISLTAGLLLVVSATLLGFVDRLIPLQYMDEVFHVPQMQKYCLGIYNDYDPKLTTPPGLYVISLAILKPFVLVWGETTCVISTLRFLNLLYLLFLFLASLMVLRNRGFPVWHWLTVMSALNVCFFPLIYFFVMLYYTDLISVGLVALSYAFHLGSSTKSSAIVAMLSVGVRQTNIVWLVFVLALTVYTTVHRFVVYQRQKATRRPPPRRDQPDLPLVVLVSELWSHWRLLPSLAVKVLRSAWPHLVMLAICGLLFVYNGGAALGDKEAHVMTFHATQFLYCHLFIAGFSLPLWLTWNIFGRFVRHMRSRKMMSFCLILTIFMAVHFFTFDHPYLLADNRHFTFYIWRRWFLRHWLCEYLLIPVYAFSVFVVYESLSSQSLVWRIGFAMSIMCSCVPNRLIEFRYFINAWMLWRLSQVRCSEVRPIKDNFSRQETLFWRVLIELLMFLMVNLITCYLYLFVPFEWAESPNVEQRFMW